MSSISQITTPDGSTYDIKAKQVDCTSSSDIWDDTEDSVIVDRNGTTFKIDYSLLAKAIIEEYAGSTLNGTEQSVKSMLDKFVGTNISSNTDLNNLTAPGFYYCSSSTIARSLVNCPVTAVNFTLIVMNKGGALTRNQLLISGGSAISRIFTRTRTSSAWSAWKSFASMEDDFQPLQEQVGALRYLEFLINAGETKTFTLPNAIQFKLITMSITTECMSEVLIATANNGNLFYTEILKGTSITIDYSVKNKLTLTNSGAYGMRVRFLIFTKDKTITLDEDNTAPITSPV